MTTRKERHEAAAALGSLGGRRAWKDKSPEERAAIMRDRWKVRRARAVKLAPILAGVALLLGCASDVRLRHPQTGKVVTCAGGSRYGLGGHLAQQDHLRCLDDYQRQGYERSE